MKISSAIRVALLALTAFAGACFPPLPCRRGQRVADDLQGGMDHRGSGGRRRVNFAAGDTGSQPADWTTASCSADRRRCCMAG